MTRHVLERRHAPAGRADSIGFTLVELMVAIAVLAILIGIATPSLTEALLGSRLASYANDLSSSALLARSEAIKRNGVVTLCVSSNGSACGTGAWEQGWIVLAGATVLHRHEALPSGLRLTETDAVERVDFRPTGVVATQTTFTVCRSSPNVGPQERIVNISATGRTSIERTTAGTCP